MTPLATPAFRAPYRDQFIRKPHALGDMGANATLDAPQRLSAHSIFLVAILHGSRPIG
jgi:hypothetical protein